MAMAKKQPKAVTGLEKVRAAAAKLPEAWKDTPWGEVGYKVGKKLFLITFDGEWKGERFISLSMKLPVSVDEALAEDFASPTGYNLGKSGWVTCKFRPDDELPVEQLIAWVRESYVAIAPKKLGRLVEDD
jgi:predicted DNA-binding protein (MmcQ/YjbR family)